MWNAGRDAEQRRRRRGPDGRRRSSRPGYPPTWPTDGRDGGVPDPTAAGPQMIQIGTEGGFLPAPVVLANHAGRLRLQPPRHRRAERHEPHAAARPGRAGRRDRRLLAGAGRLQAHPVQRRARAGPGVRPALRLLHRRPGPDRRPAARRRPCPATARTPAPSCSSRCRPGTAGARVQPGQRCRRRCRPPTARPSRSRSCRRRPTTPPSARRRRPTPTRGSRTPP